MVMPSGGHGNKYERPAIAGVAVSGFKNLHSGLVSCSGSTETSGILSSSSLSMSSRDTD